MEGKTMKTLLLLTMLAGFTYAGRIDLHEHHDDDHGYSSVPEPGTWMLMAAGIGAIGWIKRNGQ
tara:strand:+ start:241 stop:432 length:192 start_codon:yes stop_codon:yes gene_type:complete